VASFLFHPQTLADAVLGERIMQMITGSLVVSGIAVIVFVVWKAAR
jgi:hypothetical protein